MFSKCVTAVALAALASSPVLAQDAGSVLRSAAKVMGTENLSAITYYGSGANFTLGQNNNANGPWPRVPLNDYRRSIDFTQPASRASAVTWGVPVTGGPAVQGAFNQVITPANDAWAQHLEIWITPWGFLKGAIAHNATAKTQLVGGKKYDVVTWMSTQKAPSGLAYKVVGYLSAQHLVDKVETLVENPVFGDLLVETTYSDYRDKDGLKYPTTIVQKRGGWPTFDAQVLGANANPPNIEQLLTPPPPAGRGGAAVGGPPPAGQAPAAASEKLADGVYRIVGAYNALAVEFRDHIFLYEPGPQSEARSLAIMTEAKRVIPNKPIRYGVISHHHFDHTSGLSAVVAEGVTIVTHDDNKAFFEKALTAPRTLAPDAMTKSGKKPKIETVGDKRVFQDDTRVVEVHLIKGLPHADGLLVAYLPKEKILAYADMFNLPPAADPVPNPPVVGTMVFADNLQRLKLDVDRIMSVHTLNPDRLTSPAEILKSLGRTN